MKTESITCMYCPNRCRVTLTIENDKVSEVNGNGCKRGITYAKAAYMKPTRMLTTFVFTTDGQIVGVKNDKPIPKDLVEDVMSEILKAKAHVPSKAGDVVIKDVLGTGSDIVTTRSVS